MLVVLYYRYWLLIELNSLFLLLLLRLIWLSLRWGLVERMTAPISLGTRAVFSDLPPIFFSVACLILSLCCVSLVSVISSSFAWLHSLSVTHSSQINQSLICILQKFSVSPLSLSKQSWSWLTTWTNQWSLFIKSSRLLFNIIWVSKATFTMLI